MDSIAIKLDPGAYQPTRSHEHDAGLDLAAKHHTTIPVGGHHLADTGVHITIPAGHVGLLTPRSSLTTRYGVTVANSPGVIDSGYTGEIKIPLVNHGTFKVQLDAGQRIAQLLIIPITTPAVHIVDELTTTPRGDGGFGSTDVSAGKEGTNAD